MTTSCMMSEDYSKLVDIPVTVNHVKNCIFSNWYKVFKAHTPKAEIIGPLPSVFIKYLEQDGIKLFNERFNSFNDVPLVEATSDNEYSDWEDVQTAETDKCEDEQEAGIIPEVDFPELHEKLKDVFKRMSSVAPKFNWSAPKDATWILANGTMQCKEVNDIYLLLKASNYIGYDLQNAFDECIDQSSMDKTVDFELILREWFNINPALEFRVFVHAGSIVGVSQRDLNYYEFLAELENKFKEKIDKFVYGILLKKFPDDSFVADVYIPRPYSKVWLIDINPFSRKTDSLMFSWNELFNLDTKKSEYEMRLLTEHNMGRFAFKEHSHNHVPAEIVEASLDPEALKELTLKWNELLLAQKLEDD